jgi:hypothetical protein
VEKVLSLSGGAGRHHLLELADDRREHLAVDRG